MNNSYRRLPPLSSLIGFEAAARLGSFSLAALELNVTQSAISHQVRGLEKHLEQPLFIRISRRVELTDAGRDLRTTAEAALETVRQGVRRLEAYSKPASVVLHLPPDIAALWYMKRLSPLRAAMPDVDPWLHTQANDIDLREAEIDISVTRNPEASKGDISALFFREDRVPLASPAVAAEFRGSPATTALIHDERPEDWQKWFSLANLGRDEFASGLNFSDSALAMQAAVQGLGVCLGSVQLAADWIEDGRLQITHETVVPGESVLYLVTLRRNLQRQSVRKLWDWFIDQCPSE